MASSQETAHLLLQAIGPSARVEPEVRAHRIEADDLYLLCSDGLHRAVRQEVLEHELSNARQLEPACRRLIDLARADGGRDNITAVLVRFNA